MKITIYTITDCQFSKQEKEYLKSHNLPFEEKNLETNREFLTEMLTISNNFAGTPVTKVDKDDGQIAVLKGFTQKEFDDLLGFTTPEKPESASVKTTADEGKKAETAPADVAPIVTEPKPSAPPVTPPADKPVDLSADSSSVTVVKEEASTKVDPMTDVLKTLETQAAEPFDSAQGKPPTPLPVSSQEVVPQQASVEAPVVPPTPPMPTIPDPQL